MGRFRTLPLRLIGNAILLVGLILLGGASLGAHMAGTRPQPSPSATLPSSTPTRAPTPTPEPTSTTIPEPTKEVADPASPPTRLVIPSLGVDAPVVTLPIVDKTWDMAALTDEIAHLGGTANPGEDSNMVLAGHVTLRIGAGPFAAVERLEQGDTATVYAGEEAYTYRVVTKKYVAPDDVSVIHPASRPILTLLTCTSWDAENRTYRQRVAVIAELVEELPPTRSRSRLAPDQ